MLLLGVSAQWLGGALLGQGGVEQELLLIPPCPIAASAFRMCGAAAVGKVRQPCDAEELADAPRQRSVLRRPPQLVTPGVPGA